MKPPAVSPGVKQQKSKADHSRSSTATVKNAWSYTTNSPYVLMELCLINEEEEEFYFCLFYIQNIFSFLFSTILRITRTHLGMQH
jgi:hypothetical protein